MVTHNTCGFEFIESETLKGLGDEIEKLHKTEIEPGSGEYPCYDIISSISYANGKYNIIIRRR